MTMLKRLPSFLNISTAFMQSLIQISLAISFVGYLFVGPLASYATMAVYPILLGAIICQLITALFSSLPIAMSPPQNEPLPIYAMMSVAIVSSINATSDLYPTVLVAIGLSTLATGGAFYLLGRYQLGNLIRFIPFPVIVGYLVSIGLLLVIGSLEKCLPQNQKIDTIAALFNLPVLLSWLPVLGSALLAFWAGGKCRSLVVLPGFIILSLLLFYSVVFFADIPMSTLREYNFLFEGIRPEDSLDYFKKIALGHIDWHALYVQIPNILVIVSLSVFSLLLLATSLETETNMEMDFNKELRTAGWGNILAGLSGGLCCYISVVDTLINKEMKVQDRKVGLMTPLFTLLFFIFGMSMIAYIPRSFLFGLMLYFGFILIKSWLYDSVRKLSKADIGIVFSIILVVVFIGLLQGVIVGLLIAIGLFVINYSRVSTVKYYLSGKYLRSSKNSRSLSGKLLNKYGDETLFVKLQGYIFFGTSFVLTDYLTTLIKESKRPIKFLILDFERVTSVDSSASFSFNKLKADAVKNNYRIVLTELNSTIVDIFEQTGVIIKQDKALIVRATYDSALEWCERHILDCYHSSTETSSDKPYDFLKDEATQKVFKSYCEKMMLSKGEFLIRKGDPTTALYYIVSGMLDVSLEINGHFRRIALLEAGSAVGGAALYLKIPRTSFVKAEEDTVLLKLTIEQLMKMQEENPRLALEFQTVILRQLAERLWRANRQIEILLQ